MTKEEYAEKLNGIDYDRFRRLSRDDFNDAKESGLVVVHGYSDDNAEFRGALYEEISATGDTIVYVSKDGFFDSYACDCECKYFKKAEKDFEQNAKAIKALWCPKDENGKVIASWTYETDIPHAVFDVVEDGEIYCKGIVFNLSDL
jgi:hypothetical protein